MDEITSLTRMEAENLVAICQLDIPKVINDSIDFATFAIHLAHEFESRYCTENDETHFESWMTLTTPCDYYEAIEAYAALAIDTIFGDGSDFAREQVTELTKMPRLPRDEIIQLAKNIAEAIKITDKPVEYQEGDKIS